MRKWAKRVGVKVYKTSSISKERAVKATVEIRDDWFGLVETYVRERQPAVGDRQHLGDPLDRRYGAHRRGHGDPAGPRKPRSRVRERALPHTACSEAGVRSRVLARLQAGKVVSLAGVLASLLEESFSTC